jgi:hypothetical protein
MIGRARSKRPLRKVPEVAGGAAATSFVDRIAGFYRDIAGAVTGRGKICF